MATQQEDYQDNNGIKPLLIDNDAIGQLNESTSIFIVKIDVKGLIVSVNSTEMYLNSLLNHSPYITLNNEKLKKYQDKYNEYIKDIANK